MWSNEEREKFRFIMRKLGLIYSKKVTDELVEVYEFCFQKFDFEQVSRALGQCIRTCKFFPTPAEIFEVLFGAGSERAEAAYYVFIEALKRFGAYKSVRFEDKIIHYVVEQLGGWVYLASLSIDDLKFIKHDFISLYERAWRIGIQEQTSYLRGLAELSNTSEIIEQYKECFEVVNVPCPYSFALSESKIDFALPLHSLGSLDPGVVAPPKPQPKRA